MKNKIIYIILLLVILIGAKVYKTNGFNKELAYSNKQEIKISTGSALDVSKIEEIAKEVLGNKKVIVHKVERFGNAVEIVSTAISKEEKESIINKINEQFNENISNGEIEIISISEVNSIDLLKKFILPISIAYIVIIAYFLIIYNKLGTTIVLLKAILIPAIVELTYYSIIAITRIPFNRFTNGIAIGIFMITIGGLSICFRKEKEKLPTLNTEKENDK